MRLIVSGLVVALSALSAPSAARAVEVGAEAPEIGLDDMRGQRIGIRQFRGEVLVLSTWASWCEPCQHELPALQRMFARHRERGLRVVGVNVDRDEATMRQFVEQLGLTFPNVHDSRRATAMRWGATMMPSVFVVGPDGVVRYTHMSYQPGDERTLEREVIALLPEAPAERTSRPSASESRRRSGDGGADDDETQPSSPGGDAPAAASGEEPGHPTVAPTAARESTAERPATERVALGPDSDEPSPTDDAEDAAPPPASPSSAGRRGGLCSASARPPRGSSAIVLLVGAASLLVRRRRRPRSDGAN